MFPSGNKYLIDLSALLSWKQESEIKRRNLFLNSIIIIFVYFLGAALIPSSYIKVAKPLKHHLNVPPELGLDAPYLVANNGQWISLPFGLYLGCAWP